MITDRTSSSIFLWLRQVKKVKLTSTVPSREYKLSFTKEKKISTYESKNPPMHKVNR